MIITVKVLFQLGCIYSNIFFKKNHKIKIIPNICHIGGNWQLAAGNRVVLCIHSNMFAEQEGMACVGARARDEGKSSSLQLFTHATVRFIFLYVPRLSKAHTRACIRSVRMRATCAEIIS